jgi:hypothetical protein
LIIKTLIKKPAIETGRKNKFIWQTQQSKKSFDKNAFLPDKKSGRQNCFLSSQ